MRHLSHARAASAGMIAALGLAGPALAQPAPITVSSTDELIEALAQAEGGETILLEGGNYGEMKLEASRRLDLAFPSTVTIASADPENPAVFTWVDFEGLENVVIDGLRFDYTFGPGHPDYLEPFELKDSRNVTIRNSVFDGDVARGVSDKVDGYGWAKGLGIGSSQDITLENNEFFDFLRGVTVGGVDGFTFRGNRMHSIRSDGMNFVVVHDVLVEGNLFYDFRRAPNAGDHADMIQFWTVNKTEPSTGITIRANVFNSGHGDATQTLFMRNEEVDQGRAGEEMFYRDVLIEENVIVNGHLHGISIGETKGLVIRNNTLLRNQSAAQGEDRQKDVRIPRINVTEAAQDVVIENNIAVSVPEPQPGWTVRGNLSVQDVTPTRPGYYHLVFQEALTGDPLRLESFAYRPEGAAGAAGGPGASMLRR